MLAASRGRNAEKRCVEPANIAQAARCEGDAGAGVAFVWVPEGVVAPAIWGHLGDEVFFGLQVLPERFRGGAGETMGGADDGHTFSHSCS